jgi:hypothetical protein
MVTARLKPSAFKAALLHHYRKSFRLDFPPRKVKNTPSKFAVSFFVREEGPGCELWLVAQSARKPKVDQY